MPRRTRDIHARDPREPRRPAHASTRGSHPRRALRGREPDAPDGLVAELIAEPVTRWTLGAFAVGLGVVVVGIRAWLKLVSPLPGDEAIAARFPHPRTPEAVAQVADFFAATATPLVALLTVVAAAWIVDRRVGRRAAVGVVAASASAAASTALKLLWGPTPLYASITDGSQANYPSGHVTYATALFGFLAYLGLERRRPEVAAVAAVLIAGMGPSRVIDGSHLPSDILGGYLLGAAWLLAVVLWTTWRQGAPTSRHERGVPHDIPR